MSILRVRDAAGNVREILAIKGEPGEKPVNGVDYNTPEEKTAFLNEFIQSVNPEDIGAAPANALPDEGWSGDWFYRFYPSGVKELFYKSPTMFESGMTEIKLTMPYHRAAEGFNNDKVVVQIEPVSYQSALNCYYEFSEDGSELTVEVYVISAEYDGGEYDVSLNIHIIDLQGIE